LKTPFFMFFSGSGCIFQNILLYLKNNTLNDKVYIENDKKHLLSEIL